MKLLAGLFLGAIGVVLLMAGASGSAQQLWTTIFGKGYAVKPSSLPLSKASAPATNYTPPAGTKTTPSTTLPELPGYTFPQQQGSFPATTSSFNGTNTLTGTLSV